MNLTFLGATGTVTGSRYLISTGRKNILVDSGLFQGYKHLRLRNWDKPPFSPRDIHALLLTHAHIDHSGYIPVLVKNGFKGPIYSSIATRDLCKILLPDSGYLQEEEAHYINKRGYSKHKPALALYNREDAEKCLHFFKPVPVNKKISLGADMSFTLKPAGHILGASTITLSSKNKTIVFSGDLGRPHDPVTKPPLPIHKTDYLVIESTYGNRVHVKTDILNELGQLLNKTLSQGGTVIIPAFAVGRTQLILYYLALLKKHGLLQNVPIYLNSPMATNVTEIFCKHHREHRLTLEDCENMCRHVTLINNPEQSKAINFKTGPMIIISASGMATGGRVVHHIKAFAPNPKNLLLFTGFQAGGTRGALIVNGAKTVKIHGEVVDINAQVANLDSLSAHADSDDIISWLKNFKKPPIKTFITHGEPDAAEALRRRISDELGWEACVPQYGDKVKLV
ncbi:MBL fold metallo-hydrolase [bacterium]|nr:MBL fold metallo-hydrolase [bacterium]